MFRLINAILAYPPTMATDLRIANALGDVGPLSIATAAQNLIILWLLSTIVSPGVAAFCAYAIIATLFDTFFLLTFFVAVLNVDIRRLELQDSIARSNHATQKKRTTPAHGTWFDALMHGRVPFSTRMAGSAVTTTFILSLNYHFFERKETVMKLRHLLGLVVGRGSDDLTEYESFASPPMNATLTPGEWIRMQDFDTAREVMRLVKPGAHNLVIRIFSPLIVVLSGADRTGVPQGMDAVTSALRGFALHHFYPFAVVVVFVVAFVAVLMNFLLWNEASEASEQADERSEDGLGVQHIALPHRLDVVKIASSPRGHFMTIGLDRSIAVSLYDRTQAIYFVDDLSSEVNTRLTWPIRNMAMDKSGEILAFHCANDEVVVFSRTLRGFLNTSIRYPDDHPPVVFAFEHLPASSGLEHFFLILTSGGRCINMCLSDTNAPTTAALSERLCLGASIIKLENQSKQLFVVWENARLETFTFDDGKWTPSTPRNPQCMPPLEHISGAVSIQKLAESGQDLLIITSGSPWVYFVDAQTTSILTTLPATNTISPQSIILGRRTKCDACISPALHDITLATESTKPHHLVLETRTPTPTEAADSPPNSLCLTHPKTLCTSLETAQTSTTTLPSPGTWRALPSHALLGIRKRPTPPPPAATPGTATTHLRNRHNRRSSHPSPSQEDTWEAYTLSLPSHALQTLPLASSSLEDDDQQHQPLYITHPGPTAPLDSLSAAFAFGNAVKVLRAPAPASEAAALEGQMAAAAGMGVVVGSRRRGGTGSGRKAI